MLGAVSPDSFDTLHSYSNTFQMPFVTPWFPEKVLAPSSGFLDFAISMRPDYHQAIIDVVRYYGWKKIIYLYDSHDGKLAANQSEEFEFELNVRLCSQVCLDCSRFTKALGLAMKASKSKQSRGYKTCPRPLISCIAWKS